MVGTQLTRRLPFSNILNELVQYDKKIDMQSQSLLKSQLGRSVPASPAVARRGVVLGVMLSALVGLSGLAVAQQSTKRAAPAELSAFANNGAPWRLMGSGALRFLGFRAYDANLWATSATANPLEDQSLFALEIDYNTALRSEEIVKLSIAEMGRLRKPGDAQVRRWTEQLQKAFPSVQKGDKLVGVNVPNVGVRYFFNGKQTAEINDPQLSEAFFAIWLDPATKRPELRNALLGSASSDNATAAAKDK